MPHIYIVQTCLKVGDTSVALSKGQGGTFRDISLYEEKTKMAATWLLQALYTSLLGSGGLHGNASDVTYLLANTTSGTVRGKVDFEQKIPVATFFGIPYAKPPVGK